MSRIKRGEIYMARLQPTNGSVQAGTRPVLIIQNNMGNRYSPTTIVVPITTKKKNKSYLPTHVKVPKYMGLYENSVILCEQIMTIDKGILGEKICKISRRKQIETNFALTVSIFPGLVDMLCQKYNFINPLKRRI